MPLVGIGKPQCKKKGAEESLKTLVVQKLLTGFSISFVQRKQIPGATGSCSSRAVHLGPADAQSSPTHIPPLSEAHSIPEGMATDGILSGKGSAAQHDEDQDKVGEDVVVNELVAAYTDPVEKSTAWTQSRTRA